MTPPTWREAAPAVAVSVAARRGEEEEEEEEEERMLVRGSVGWMNRSDVRKRVMASITPGQKRQKHIIAAKDFDMEGRQWIWDYCNNYKAATVGLSLFGFFLCLCGILMQSTARSGEWTLCDWTTRIACGPAWRSSLWFGFGLVPALLGDESYFNLPNDILLIVFYFLQIILSDGKGPKFVKAQLVLSAAAAAGGAFLAFGLLAWLDLWACPFAVVQFSVNSAIGLANVARWGAMKRLEASKRA